MRIPQPYTESDAEEFLGIAAEAIEKYGHPVHFAIRDEFEKALGGIGFDNLTYRHRAELGYWLGVCPALIITSRIALPALGSAGMGSVGYLPVDVRAVTATRCVCHSESDVASFLMMHPGWGFIGYGLANKGTPNRGCCARF